jgi:hypothetical protein
VILSPAFSPVMTGFDVEVVVPAARFLAAASISSSTIARGTVTLIAKAISATAPALLAPNIGSRTARPNTGVADVASIRL